MLLRPQQLRRGLVSALTLLAIIALAAGLSSVELQPGLSLSPDLLGGSTKLNPISRIQLPSTLLVFVTSLLRVGFWVLLPLAIIHFIRSRSARKRVLLQLFYMLIFAYVLISLSSGLNLQAGTAPQLPPGSTGLPGTAEEFSLSIPSAPAWVFFALSAVAVGIIAFGSYRIYQSTRDRQAESSEMGQEARAALESLEAGAELESVIQRAYLRLCQSSWSRRGIARAKHSTAREFEGQLSSAGLPMRSVGALTRLFEKSRYGDAPMEDEDEREAVSALREILRTLGEL
jgi:hypothetical protein